MMRRLLGLAVATLGLHYLLAAGVSIGFGGGALGGYTISGIFAVFGALFLLGGLAVVLRRRPPATEALTVAAQLKPDERLLWEGQPDPERYHLTVRARCQSLGVQLTLVGALFGAALLILLPLSALPTAPTLYAAAIASMAALAVAFAVGPGLYMQREARLARTRAASVHYAITEARAFVLRVDRPRGPIGEETPEGPLSLYAKEGSRDLTDLRFEPRPTRQEKRGDGRKARVGSVTFIGIADGARVEQLARDGMRALAE